MPPLSKQESATMKIKDWNKRINELLLDKENFCTKKALAIRDMYKSGDMCQCIDEYVSPLD